jgi:DUF1365 family protein
MSPSAPHPAHHQAQIGFGQVWHQRLRPARHAFQYGSYFLMLPMRALRAKPSAALVRNRWGLISFHDADHGAGGPDALAWFEALLTQEGIADAEGEIWLQTFPRVLGYAFKPVSFWFAHRANGELAAVLAEVNNTFGERHGYLLTGPSLGWGRELPADKVFHVSPFCNTEGQYRFRFDQLPTPGGVQHMARIDLLDAQGPLLQTSLSGRLVPLNASSLRRAFFGTPLMTLGVVLRIHWQALRLWLKRVPFVHKPAAPEQFVTR